MDEPQDVTSYQELPDIACPHAEAVGERWGDSISKEREAELRAILHTWYAPGADHGERKGPFAEIALTGADVYFLSFWRSTPLRIEGRLISVAALHLEGASLGKAHLEGAFLERAHLEDSILSGAHLEKAILSTAHLEGAVLWETHLEDAVLGNAHLEHADLFVAHLKGANLRRAYLKDAHLSRANLENANLTHAHLESADLSYAYLNGADLSNGHFEHGDLRAAHLENSDLSAAHLEGANLKGCWLDSKTILKNTVIDHTTRLGDIHWSGIGAVDLTQINWDRVAMVGDERGVGLLADSDDHAAAVRAYRQLAAQLRTQGMNEVADRFAYRAQVRQLHAYMSSLRHDWRHPLHWFESLNRTFASLFLAALAGFGYRPGRTLFWYIMTIVGYMSYYGLVTHGVPLFGLTEPSGTQPLHWYEALVLSVASFHGRGFFPQGMSLGDPVAILAASEAVIGLFIEISFIATFTQRYFAR